MEDNKKRSIFDYAAILLAIIGFASLFLFPNFMEGYFSLILLSIMALAFLTRLVVLVKKKSFGLHFIVFLLLTIVVIYLLYDLI
ncbi:hypothetical protein [Oceanobacillus sp. CFH 90083]|uniref:hypothetical protein n=1 Tax=Oceanobacillus sp. CFH 90083 TaxID=2592336 RepID=UPI00128D57DB|nr:hypothetical protein [Oceanobacillus sp. CFH 90083]